MKRTAKQNFVKEKKGADEISRLFRELEEDKKLPSFGECFMSCLLIGNSERVNLKALFPELHQRLSLWLKAHQDIVKAKRVTS